MAGQPQPDTASLAGRLAQYVEWMRFHHFSTETLRSRTSQVRQFVAWCEERGLVRPSEVTKPIVERYQAYLFDLRKNDGAPLALHTQRSRLDVVRVFFKWMARQNHILYNPASDIDLPRLPRILPKHVLTAEEAERVLAVPDVETLLGLRDRTILEVLYSTGIRRIELVRLAVYDLNAHGGTLMIREGKGRHQRIVPIGERAIAWIKRYLAETRPRLAVGPDPESLFLWKDGGPIKAHEITRMAHACVLAAGIDRGGSAHVFRHTMATLMLEGGADIRFIQAILGHAKIESTEVYAHVAIGKLKEVHAATHPASMPQGPPGPPPASG